jgi:hypothetical protein
MSQVSQLLTLLWASSQNVVVHVLTFYAVFGIFFLTLGFSLQTRINILICHVSPKCLGPPVLALYF